MTDLATVFVVDDDPAVRRSVSALVESMGAGAELFESAEDFLASYDLARPGCLVTDMRMPGMNGLELQQKLVDDGAVLPVIVITAYAEVPIAVTAMKNGALTLLEKPCRSEELWRAVHDGLQLAAKVFPQHEHRLAARKQLATLTPAETSVLDSIMAGRSNKATALALNIGLRTVEKRRQMIFQKMQASSVSELVRLVMDARSNELFCCCGRTPWLAGGVNRIDVN